jgi:hypothetical protein
MRPIAPRPRSRNAGTCTTYSYHRGKSRYIDFGGVDPA